MINLKDMDMDQLKNFLAEMGQTKFRADQIFKWLNTPVETFDQMTNISKELRRSLSEISYISVPVILKKYCSKIDETIKYVIQTGSDGACVESVVMRYNHGTTICVSTQVGCKMGCVFCASATGGLIRNLSAGEILDQVLFIQRDLDSSASNGDMDVAQSGAKISNIVLMGVGEPLDNFDNTIKFIKNVNHHYGMNIGQRHISLSTCGLVNQIKKLYEQNLPVTLSVSLHAPNDDIRNKIMPVSKKYPMNELLTVCRQYTAKTNRRITFQYAMIENLNDSPVHANELGRKLKGMLCHINLIPVNTIDDGSCKKSSRSVIESFKSHLEKYNISVTIRRELGSDISASCGQLIARNNAQLIIGGGR